MKRLIKKSNKLDIYSKTPELAFWYTMYNFENEKDEEWPVYKWPSSNEFKIIKEYYSWSSERFSIACCILKNGEIYGWPSGILHEFMKSEIPQIYTSESIEFRPDNYEDLKKRIEILNDKNWFN